MKKIITLMLTGFIFLSVPVIGKDYNIVTKKNGGHFEMLWITGADTIFGEYAVPEELSEKEATDVILGKVKSLKKRVYIGTIKKEGSLMDQYLLKTYILAASCEAINVDQKFLLVPSPGILNPFLLFCLLYSPFALLFILFSIIVYKYRHKILMHEINLG